MRNNYIDNGIEKKSEKREKKLRKNGDEKEGGRSMSKDHDRMRTTRRKGAVDQANLLMEQTNDT